MITNVVHNSLYIQSMILYIRWQQANFHIQHCSHLLTGTRHRHINVKPNIPDSPSAGTSLLKVMHGSVVWGKPFLLPIKPLSMLSDQYRSRAGALVGWLGRCWFCRASAGIHEHPRNIDESLVFGMPDIPAKSSSYSSTLAGFDAKSRY